MSQANAVLRLFETKDFQRQLRRVARRGGTSDAVHRQVVEALILWSKGHDPQLPRTHHGERRIAHTVKYDLKGFHRIVCYEHAGQRIPLFVGSHDEVDRWLDANRGRDFTVNHASRRVRLTPVDADEQATSAAVTTSNDEIYETGLGAAIAPRGPVLERLPDDLLRDVGLTADTLASLNHRLTFENVTRAADEDGFRSLVRDLQLPSDGHRNVIIQLVGLIARGQEDEAAERLQLFLGRAATATCEPAVFAAAVARCENSDYLVNLSELSSDDIERLVGGDQFTDWMLFLHAEQRRLVERDFAGPARLIGVSGSGKTSVLVHRANTLAKKYPDDRILVLTLNPALANLLSFLLDRLCARSLRPRIVVQTIYQYCYQAVKAIAPDRLIEKQDSRSGETLTSCWSDFLKKQHALASVGPVVDALEGREDRVDAAAYLRDELIWIRSGFGRKNRGAYVTCERPGRGIQLPRMEFVAGGRSPSKSVGGFPPDTRLRILRLLDDYEEYMQAGGLLDEDGVSLEAFSVKEQIQMHPQLRARCVLVDEVQDCSTVELSVIAQIPKNAANGLFLTGDPVQKVFAKQHDHVRAQIDIRGRSSVLKTNYRNTRQILQAAFTILEYFRDLSPVPPADVVEPDYAFRDGPRPALVECETVEQQLLLVLTCLDHLSVEERNASCVCSPSAATLDGIASELDRKGEPYYRVHGTSECNTAVEPGVKLALLQDIKGYEFSQVFLVDVMDRFMLPAGMPYDERWRPAFQIYVAMTRAREELTMTFVDNRSILLRPLGDTVDEALAREVLHALGGPAGDRDVQPAAAE